MQTDSQSGGTAIRARSRLSLSTRILLGLSAGIACGLFFGERAARLSLIGDAFVGLLQMTVLPYIVVSLIANIGRLSLEQSRRLLVVGGVLTAFFLVIGCVALYVIPWSFPELPTASFFSRSTIESHEEIDLVSLYIPTNPFQSLSSGTIPAVVLFCILIGLGLIPVKNKGDLIRVFDAIGDSLVHFNKIAINLTPIGVFAIAAAAAGTMTLEEVGRLEAYLVAYTVATAILTFFILPAIVAAVTPFRFRDVLRVSKGTLLLIFVTGKIVIVLPQIVEDVKVLLRTQRDRAGDGSFEEADILVPLIFPFPKLGTIVIFMFLPFTAWFLGNPMEARDYPMFLGATLLVSFVAPVVGIPFLLDLFKLPTDMVHLFVASSIYTDRVRVVLGGMHLFVFTVLAVAILHGMVRMRTASISVWAVSSVALTVASAFGVQALLRHSMQGAYTRDKVIGQMQLLDAPATSVVLQTSGPNPVALKTDEGLLDRIRHRGVLRFGYEPDRIPFCFTNSTGELVGYDIDLIHRMARTLEVRLEFVPTTRQTLAEQAAADHFDLAGCAFTLTARRAERLALSAPYLDLHAALVVPDHRRHELDSAAALAREPNLTIGVATDTEFAELLEEWIPGARIVRLKSAKEFLTGGRPDVDALFTSAEAGSAMTLLYPMYTVVLPEQKKIAMPSVLVLSKTDHRTEQFINDWILLRQKNGVMDRLYNHWILGQTAENRGPRWSIGRNVLGWLQ